MLKPYACFFTIMLCVVPRGVAAQEETESGPQVEGTMVGGEISLGSSGTTFGPSLQVWGENLGIRLGFALGILKGDISSGGNKADLDQTALAGEAELLFGFPMERAKPHLAVGVGYASTKQETTFGADSESTKSTATEFIVGLGVDFLAAPNVTIGIGLLEIGFFLDGELEQEESTVDMGGFALGLFNSLSVRYVF